MSKSLVIVTPSPSHPTTAGNRARVLEIGRRFREKGYTIVFICLNLENCSASSIEEMRSYWDYFQLVNAPSEPLDYAEIDDGKLITKDMIDAVSEACAKFKPSVVLVNYVWMSAVFEAVPTGTVKVIDAHDRFAERHSLLKLGGIDPTWVNISLRQEGIGAERADILLAITEKEQVYFRALTGRRVDFIPHVGDKNFCFTPQSKTVFVFLGSANSLNEESVNFIRRIAPEFAGSASFVVVGSSSQYVRNTDLNVETISYINDISKLAQQGFVFINPVFIGTGTKIKSIDAIRHGMPIISGKAGFEGIRSDCKFHKLTDEESFVAALWQVARGDVDIEELASKSCRSFEDLERTSTQSLDTFFRDIENNHQPIFASGIDKSQIKPVDISSINIFDDINNIFNPLESRDKFVKLALISLEAGLFKEALPYLHSSLTIDPLSASFQAFYAYACILSGNVKEATKSYSAYEWLSSRKIEDYVPPPSIHYNMLSVINEGTSNHSDLVQSIFSAVRPYFYNKNPRLTSKNDHRLVKSNHIYKQGELYSNRFVVIPRDRTQNASAADVFSASVIFPNASELSDATIIRFDLSQIPEVSDCLISFDGIDIQVRSIGNQKYQVKVFDLVQLTRGRRISVDLKVLFRSGHVSMVGVEKSIKVSLHQDLSNEWLTNLLGPQASPYFVGDLIPGTYSTDYGHHQLEQVGDGFYWWAKQKFQITIDKKRLSGYRNFLEIDLYNILLLDEKSLISSIEADISTLYWQVIELDRQIGRARLFVEIDVPQEHTNLIRVCVNTNVPERPAAPNDAREVSVYVTKMRLWGADLQDHGERNLLNFVRRPFDRKAHLPDIFRLDLAPLNLPNEEIVLHIQDTSIENSSPSKADIALRLDNNLMSPIDDRGPGLIFSGIESQNLKLPHTISLYLSHYARRRHLTLTAASLKRSTRSPERVRFSAAQEEYWLGFYDLELISGTDARWMSRNASIRFPGYLRGTLKLIIFPHSVPIDGNVKFKLDEKLVVPIIRGIENNRTELNFEIKNSFRGDRRLEISSSLVREVPPNEPRELTLLMESFSIELYSE
ncbi:glycosyltransferase [Methylobacterium sp. J-078]|uniref:glycosyltransferase n=1 Tax=Methylobacterium sp. J-078 TaxID=2836657 RepID=UPI001FBA36C4|nr:glycosyltransferase [Methylobacterium sp. J-078]MCJ2043561.1 glycosyltransferase [Methylobacterium sp. J-078]